MFFRLFTNPIYIASELTSYTIALVHLYINWREYKFVGNVERMPEMRPYVGKKKFERLKVANRKHLLVELVSDIWKTGMLIVFSDELSHISLWTLSLRLSGQSSEAMLPTCVFIFLTTCKDFFLGMPLNLYSLSVEDGLSVRETLGLLSVEFCIEHLAQQILLNAVVYSAYQVTHVPHSYIIFSSTLLIVSFVIAREVFLTDAIVKTFIEPFTDKKVLQELRPYLKRMNLSEKNVYVMGLISNVPNAFATGHAFLGNQKIVISESIVGK